jgi:prepilin-type N-terminal cleavage/methylation domain-containing protein
MVFLCLGHDKYCSPMKKHDTTMRGFTIVEIMIVVAIIGLLAAIALPNFAKTRATARKSVCIANLKELDGAKQQWAMENNKSGTDVPGLADLFSVRHGYIKRLPVCPLGGEYTFNDVNTPPTCGLAESDGHSL